MHQHRTNHSPRQTVNELVSRWAPKVILLGVVVIFVSTLYPFHFAAPSTALPEAVLESLTGRSSLPDVLANVILFMPLGFGLGCALAKRPFPVYTRLGVAVVLCGGLSLLIETLQLFLPGRNATLLDIVSNSIGGAVGLLSFQISGSIFAQIITAGSQVTDKLLAKLSLKHLTLALVAYTLLAVALVTHWQSISLKGWNTDFLLTVGGDNSLRHSRQATEGQRWSGTIADLIISDRALAKPQVEKFFANPHSLVETNESVLAAYSLRGANGTQDLTGQSPDLRWSHPQSTIAANPPAPQQSLQGTNLSTEAWLQTIEPPHVINTRIPKSAEFTLSTLVAVSNIMPQLPGEHPLISIANVVGHAPNVSLSQRDSGLQVTMSISRTMRDKNFYQHFIPNIFVDAKPHRLLMTYSGFVIRVYVDGVEQLYLLDTTPNRYQIVLYLLILIPLAFLIALVSGRLTHRAPIYLLLVGGGTVLPSFVLEGLLASGGDRSIRAANLLLGMLIVGGAIVVFQGDRSRKSNSQLLGSSH